MDNIEVIVQENITSIVVTVDFNEGGGGADGLSAYQIAVENGFVGTEQEWLDSLVGADGQPGTNGTNGVDGAQGVQGLTGAKGDKGDVGNTGLQGEQGLPGSDGIDGETGAKGDKGDTGNTGNQGIQGIQGVQGVKGDTGDSGLVAVGIVQGDLIYGTGVGTVDRLPKNTTATRYLSNTGTNNAPAWAQVNLANGVTGIVVGTNGGTGQNFYAVGDILYASTSTNLTKRNIGATGQILKVVGGLPTWADADYFQNFLASGNGSATSITITHGLTGITGSSKVIVQPLNAASDGILYVTISSTTITIVYGTAPANGTNNLSYSIMVRP